MISDSLAEFFVPVDPRDLADGERMGPDRYSLSTPDLLPDLSILSTKEQQDQLHEAFMELNKKGTTYLFTNEVVFAMLLSYVLKPLPSGGGGQQQAGGSAVNRETRGVFVRGMADFLSRIATKVEQFIDTKRPAHLRNAGLLGTQSQTLFGVGAAAPSDEDDLSWLTDKDAKVLQDHRSVVKMGAFLLCHALLMSCSGGESNADQTTASQHAPSQRAGGRGGRGARRGANNKSEEEDCGDKGTRADAVIVLGKILGRKIAPLWGPSGAVDVALQMLVLRSALSMCSAASNTTEVESPVIIPLTQLLSALARTFTQRTLLHESSAAAPGGGGDENRGRGMTLNHPSDVLIAPLVDLIIRFDHAAKFVPRVLQSVYDDDASHQWAPNFFTWFFKELHRCGTDDVTSAGDSQPSKNLSLCICELAKKCVSVIATAKSILPGLLHSESYEIRKAAMLALAEIVAQVLTKPSGGGQGSLTGAEEHIRDVYLKLLRCSLKDVNPFARAYCIREVWLDVLLERRNAVPKYFRLELVREAAGRVHDRHFLVRYAALRLLASAMGKLWYYDNLDIAALETKYAAVKLACLQKYVAEAGGSEAAGLKLYEERLAYALATMTVPPSIPSDLLEHDDADSMPPMEDSVARADALPSDDNDPLFAPTEIEAAIAGGRPSLNGSSVINQSNTYLNPAPLVAATSSTSAPAPPIDDDVTRCAFYQHAIEFATIVSSALQDAVLLLESPTVKDVVEAARFVSVCAQFHVTGSDSALLRVLVLAFSDADAVQEAVRTSLLEFVCSLGLTPVQQAQMRSLSRVSRSMVWAQRMCQLMLNASEGEFAALERVVKSLSRATTTQATVEDIATGAWNIVSTETTVPEERRVCLRIFSVCTSCHPKLVVDYRQELIQLVQRYSGDNAIVAAAFASLAKESLARHFVPLEDHLDPNTHPSLRLIYHHLCRSTRQVGSWVQLAEAGINALHALCRSPALHYTRIVSYLSQACLKSASAKSGRHLQDHKQIDPCRLAQLFFVIGHSALKHLVAIEAHERAEQHLVDETRNQQLQRNSGNSKDADDGGATVDVMHKELGLGSTQFQKEMIAEQAKKMRVAMVEDPNSIWGGLYGPLILATCQEDPTSLESSDQLYLRVCAVLALSKLMIVSDRYCKEHLDLLFTIASSPHETWVVKSNVVVALGDLACVHPNLLKPYTDRAGSGFYALLADHDGRVRAITIQVCAHLVLNGMLLVNDHLHTIVRLVADRDPAIQANAVMFVQNLAVISKDKLGNIIPPLVPQLSPVMDTDSFQLVMRTLLEKVDKDKATEALVAKLCRRFGRFTDRSAGRQNLARNVAFCLSELNYSTERVVRKITSETLYVQYRQWLRDPLVYQSFKLIATKMRKSTTGLGAAAAQRAAAAAAASEAAAATSGGPQAEGAAPQTGERRDKATIEEWEARLDIDCCAPAAGRQTRGRRESDDDDVEEEDEESDEAEGDAPPVVNGTSDSVMGQNSGHRKSDHQQQHALPDASSLPFRRFDDDDDEQPEAATRRTNRNPVAAKKISGIIQKGRPQAAAKKKATSKVGYKRSRDDEVEDSTDSSSSSSGSSTSSSSGSDQSSSDSDSSSADQSEADDSNRRRRNGSGKAGAASKRQPQPPPKQGSKKSGPISKGASTAGKNRRALSDQGTNEMSS